MIKVSVIMPCLNMVRYIKNCIESVICQTMKDIEILIIDAGSTDGTLELLEEYEQKDSRIQIIRSEKKSYGYQMNVGISLAVGEYIGIVETDDIVQHDMFEVLYEEAIRESADYVKGISEGFYDVGGVEWRFSILPFHNLKEKSIVIPKNTPEVFLYDNFLWNGIYRKDFLKKIKFNETLGAAFQDIGVLFQIASRAEKGCYLNYLVYNYRQDNLNSSSYNKQCFSYVVAEYKYAEQFLSGLSRKWEFIYYLKMAQLCLDRFLLMACFKNYWTEAGKSIEELQKMISYAIEKREFNLKDTILADQIEIFLQSPIQLYDFYRKKYIKKIKKLTRILTEVKNKKVYIFGAGQYGRFLHFFLHLNNVDVVAFCDNNVEKKGQIIQTISVESPEETLTRKNNAHYIIAVRRYVREIEEQLRKLGVESGRITFYDGEIDRYLLKEIKDLSLYK